MTVEALMVAFIGAVLGAAGTAFAGAPRHVYEWATERKRRERALRAHIARIPAIEAQLQANRNAIETMGVSLQDVDERLGRHVAEFREFRGAAEAANTEAVRAIQDVRERVSHIEGQLSA